MCTGISLAWSELPTDLIDRHQLERRALDRGGEMDVRFLFADRERVLPVWHQGRLQLVRWGCRRDESRSLPCTGWTWRASVEAGKWKRFRAEPVDVPATLGLAGGVWYRIREGVRGLLVRDERGRPVVYPICEPSTHYYQVMTRMPWMPLLIDEII